MTVSAASRALNVWHLVFLSIPCAASIYISLVAKCGMLQSILCSSLTLFSLCLHCAFNVASAKAVCTAFVMIRKAHFTVDPDFFRLNA